MLFGILDFLELLCVIWTTYILVRVFMFSI